MFLLDPLYLGNVGRSQTQRGGCLALTRFFVLHIVLCAVVVLTSKLLVANHKIVS